MGHSNNTVKRACINTYRQEVTQAFRIYSVILKMLQEEIKEDNSLYVKIKNYILREYMISEKDINRALNHSNKELCLQGWVSTYYTEDFNHRGWFYEYFSTKNEFNFVIEDALLQEEQKESEERKTKLLAEIALKQLESNKLKEELETLTEELNAL